MGLRGPSRAVGITFLAGLFVAVGHPVHATQTPGEGSCKRVILLGAEFQLGPLSVGESLSCSFEMVVEQEGGFLWWDSSMLPAVRGAWRVDATAISPDIRDVPTTASWSGLTLGQPQRSPFVLVTDSRVGTWALEATYYPEEVFGHAVDTGEWVFKACHDRDESPEDGSCLDEFEG